MTSPARSPSGICRHNRACRHLRKRPTSGTRSRSKEFGGAAVDTSGNENRAAPLLPPSPRYSGERGGGGGGGAGPGPFEGGIPPTPTLPHQGGGRDSPLTPGPSPPRRGRGE